MVRPNEPMFVHGTTSPSVQSPVTSDRKISPGDPEFGSNRVNAAAVAQWLDMEKRVAPGRSIVAPTPTMCVRSKPLGPKNLLGLSKSVELLMKSWAAAWLL